MRNTPRALHGLPGSLLSAFWERDNIVEKCAEKKKPVAQGGHALPKSSGQAHMCAKGARMAMHTPTLPFPQEQDASSCYSLTLRSREH